MYTLFLGILLTAVLLWMAYELWRAPLMQEIDGRLVVKRPARTLKDLFKRKK